MKLSIGLAAAAAWALAAAAHASVIAGPPLPFDDNGYSVTGLAFIAKVDATVTSFTFQNQGKADDVVLTDGAGSILYSLPTPGAAPSDTENVNWAVTAGETYWLFQTVWDNARDDYYNKALPSDSEIALIDSGTFDTSIPAAISLHKFPQPNFYWASFNDITTTGVTPPPLPEPAGWALMLLGFGAVGSALRGRRGAMLVAPRIGIRNDQARRRRSALLRRR